MKISFTAYWCKAFQEGIKKGRLVLSPFGPNINNLGAFLNKLEAWQTEKEELRELDIQIEVHYKKRTLNMNSLMWSLYEIEATEMNGGLSLKEIPVSQRNDAVTAEKLYEADLEAYADIVTLKFPYTYQHAVYEQWKHIISSTQKIDGETMEVQAYFSTSHMNTKQHGEWIDRQFARLSENGVHLANGPEVAQYWADYAAAREPDIENWYTAEQYKEKQNFCEAEPTIYLGNGGGSIAHIVARGMGRNPMEGKYHEADIMHLSDTAHALWDNGKGRKYFLTKYPHLKKKIEAALNKEIDNSQQDLFEPTGKKDNKPELEIF